MTKLTSLSGQVESKRCQANPSPLLREAMKHHKDMPHLSLRVVRASSRGETDLARRNHESLILRELHIDSSAGINFAL
jgi:hypothetical protein